MRNIYIIHDKDKEEEINEKDLDKLLKVESDDSLVALLAAELHESKKILLETLLYLQSKDEKKKEVWWSRGSVPASGPPGPGSNLGSGPPHSVV